MPQRTFSYAGLDIGVETDAVSHLDWLEEFLAPAFLCSTRAPGPRIDLIVDPGRYERWLAAGPSGAEPVAFVLDTGPRRLPAWSTYAGRVCVHDPDMQVFYAIAEQRTLVLVAHWRPRLRSALMRPLRELAMDAAQQRGGLLLHAAAYAVDGRTAIIAGAKEAGKTSLLTYMLSAGGADYLTNDRLLLAADHGSLLARGLPTVVSIRAGTLDLFPRLWQRVAEARWRLHATLAECARADAQPARRWSDDRLGLTPAQYCAACNCRAVAEALPALLLFPRRSGRPGGLMLRPLSRIELEERLDTCRFAAVGTGWREANLAHSARGSPIGARSEVFRVDAAADTETAKDAVIRHLLQCPAFECELGNNAYADRRGAERLLRALRIGNPSHPERPGWPEEGG